MTLVKSEIKDMDCIAWMKCAFQTFCISAELTKEQQKDLLKIVSRVMSEAVNDDNR